LVFIHGLFSSSENAWRSENAYWPDLVRDDAALTEFGIYLFDYETMISSGNYSLSDAANALNEYFRLDGLSTMRQIIFVAHSAGGVVARHFITSRQRLFTEHQIHVGLFLLASPSLGSDYADFFVNLGLVHNVQVEALRFNQANIWLSDLDRQFLNLKEKPPFPLFGRELVESDPVYLPRLLFPARQVVFPASAARYFGDALKIPGSNHMTIAKPHDREALQHRMLVQFVVENALPPGPDATDPLKPEAASLNSVELLPQMRSVASSVASIGGQTLAPLDPLTRTAIAADRHGIAELLPSNASARDVYDVAIRLASGRMMERMMASWLVKRHGNPIAVYRVGLETPGGTEDQFHRSAPWLRFTVGERDRGNIWQLAQDVVASLAISEPHSLRLTAVILGMAGEDRYLPEVNWNDEWSRHKYSFDYNRAYIASASVNTDPEAIRSAIRGAVRVSLARAADDRPLHFYDYLSAFRCVPASHGLVVLNALVKAGAPDAMTEAFLGRLCNIPNERTLPTLRTLSLHENADIARAARMAAAFIPVRTTAMAEIKRSILYELDGAAAIAAGVDMRVAVLRELEQLVSPGKSANVRYAAAWALGRIARVDAAAKAIVQRHAVESDDNMVRAILLAGLAAFDPKSAAQKVAVELPISLGIERFVLLIAQSYITDAKDMLSMLASTPEDQLFVPFLLPTLHLAFSEALLRASCSAPVLSELWALGDIT
jgi:hypothetical protein